MCVLVRHRYQDRLTQLQPFVDEGHQVAGEIVTIVPQQSLMPIALLGPLRDPLTHDQLPDIAEP